MKLKNPFFSAFITITVRAPLVVIFPHMKDWPEKVAIGTVIFAPKKQTKDAN